MTFSLAVRTVPKREALMASLLVRLRGMLQSPDVLGLHISANADVAPNENGCRALEAALADRADWIVFFEDDAGPIDDLVGSLQRWLAAYAAAWVHIYPLGCQYPLPEGDAWQYPIDAFYCSVAMVMRPSLVPEMISYFRCRPYLVQSFDILLGRWHKAASECPHMLTPVPCFVDHLGDDSTLAETRPGHDAVGHFQGFKGYDFSYGGVHA